MRAADASGPSEHLHPANQARHDDRTLGDRVADGLAGGMGSWRFIIAQAAFTAAWIAANTLHGWSRWDEYPFVLLNLVYSFQAGFTGPILLLSQNRQAEHDRLRAEHDYEVDREALAWTKAIAAHLGITDPAAEVTAIDGNLTRKENR
ncbi:DUF1003 domain-containing protein [Kitasatospora sp. NPDC048545]|uniref:DUF1003 domain-containing protein n=1 Tax=Kitasatospora sp. NPDC048545 TaxID=3157208 RepID=UPI0033C76078